MRYTFGFRLFCTLLILGAALSLLMIYKVTA